MSKVKKSAEAREPQAARTPKMTIETRLLMVVLRSPREIGAFVRQAWRLGRPPEAARPSVGRRALPETGRAGLVPLMSAGRLNDPICSSRRQPVEFSTPVA